MCLLKSMKCEQALTLRDRFCEGYLKLFKITMKNILPDSGNSRNLVTRLYSILYLYARKWYIETLTKALESSEPVHFKVRGYTGAGSARPVVSMITPSSFPPVFLCSLSKQSTRSPRTVQQMQPFFTSIMISLLCSFAVKTSSSTPQRVPLYSCAKNQGRRRAEISAWFPEISHQFYLRGFTKVGELGKTWKLFLEILKQNSTLILPAKENCDFNRISKSPHAKKEFRM